MMIQEFQYFCLFLNRMIHAALQAHWLLYRKLKENKIFSYLSIEYFCFVDKTQPHKLCSYSWFELESLKNTTVS